MRQKKPKKNFSYAYVISVSENWWNEKEKIDLDEAELLFSIYLSANRRARRAAFIAFSLMLLNVLQGYALLLSYVADVFTSTNPDISPHGASIIILIVSNTAHLVFMHLVDRAGRRTYFIYSSFASTLGLILFALHLHFLSDNHTFDWLPVVCLSFTIFVSCLGMKSVPFIVAIEIFPRKVWWHRPQCSPISKYGFNKFFFFNSFDKISADRTIWICHMHIAGDAQWIRFDRTVSTGKSVYRTHWMDFILCRDEFLQRIIWNILSTWDERKISRRNYENVRRIKYWISCRVFVLWILLLGIKCLSNKQEKNK